jgi:hypothetical protein
MLVSLFRGLICRPDPKPSGVQRSERQVGVHDELVRLRMGQEHEQQRAGTGAL